MKSPRMAAHMRVRFHLLILRAPIAALIFKYLVDHRFVAQMAEQRPMRNRSDRKVRFAARKHA